MEGLYHSLREDSTLAIRLDLGEEQATICFVEIHLADVRIILTSDW